MGANHGNRKRHGQQQAERADSETRQPAPRLSRRTFVARPLSPECRWPCSGWQLRTEGLAAEAGGAYRPGTYRAAADGKFDSITVETEFSDNAISSVRVIEHRDTARIADAAVQLMPERIVSAQGRAWTR